MAMPDPLTHFAGPGMEPVSWRHREAADPTAGTLGFFFLIAIGRIIKSSEEYLANVLIVF